MPLSNEDKLCGLKTIATISTGTFACGTMYHMYALHPTLLSDVEVAAALKVQRGITKRIWPLVGSLVVGITASSSTYLVSRNKEQEIPWLIGGATLAAFFPYTSYFLSPINKKILSEQVPVSEGIAYLKRWYKFAGVRAAFTFGVFSYFTYALAKKSVKE